MLMQENLPCCRKIWVCFPSARASWKLATVERQPPRATASGREDRKEVEAWKFQGPYLELT